MKANRMTRRLLPLVACSFLLLSGRSLAQARELSLEDRVAAQKAIEQVYWNHRIWPNDNPGPKPNLQAVMPEAAIEAKVFDYLRLSAPLDASGRRPLTGDQLQAEIVRMARQTKSPEMLSEVFAALQDDPFLIAECVARPALAQRLSGAANDDEDPATIDVRPIAPPPQGYRVPKLPLGACTNDAWGLSTLTDGTGLNVPTPRQLHTAVWTGAEMIVWGGWDGANTAFNTGGRYDPATDLWSQTSLTTGTGLNIPPARYRHTAIWTGTEMIVWGGRNAAGSALNDGGRYNPATDTWSYSSLTTALGLNVPVARQLHTAVWTGTEMIVWGGTPDTASNALNDGGRYNPATDTWSLSLLTDATGLNTPVARIDHSAVWTGTEMIVWGGSDAAGSALSNGGRYNAAVNSWTFSLLTNATGLYVPTARQRHTALWTGTEMIVWGGTPDGASITALNTGGRYSPSSDAWAFTSLTNATGLYVPTARQLQTVVWTGAEMIVWGGSTDGATMVLNNGGRYRPATDTWAVSSLTNATGANIPAARQFHTAIWTDATDHRMLVWGGSPSTDRGGLYCAECPIWYQDSDGDGHGNGAVTLSSCSQPPGYVGVGGDCNDASAASHPGAAEVCNGLDDDCDTVVDDGGNTLCDDGDACTADICAPGGSCSLAPKTANLDATGFSATRVDGRDLVVLALAWNSCSPQPAYNALADLDPVSTPPGACVDAADFHLFMNSFGQSCP